VVAQECCGAQLAASPPTSGGFGAPAPEKSTQSSHTVLVAEQQNWQGCYPIRPDFFRFRNLKKESVLCQNWGMCRAKNHTEWHSHVTVDPSHFK
jgi:hypothetical protein